MKKYASVLLTLSGLFSFAQQSILVVHNQNPNFDIVGRLFTGNISPSGTAMMFAAPNGPFGSYTIPANVYHKYPTFDTSGSTGTFMDIDRWYLYDSTNPANSGTYVYTDPMITSMNSSNEWAGIYFNINDVATGYSKDSFQVGNPTLSASVGLPTNASQTGANSGVFSEWYTITAGSDQITFFTLYP